MPMDTLFLGTALGPLQSDNPTHRAMRALYKHALCLLLAVGLVIPVHTVIPAKAGTGNALHA